jgi:CheY-like chemotaxis protein
MAKYKKVLLAEDDMLTTMICEKLFKLSDFAEEIITAGNGQLALDYIQQNTTALPDVIFLDLRMPVMDGWEFIEIYQTLIPGFIREPKLYVLSSTLDPSDLSRAGEYRFVKGIISKPLKKSDLENI